MLHLKGPILFLSVLVTDSLQENFKTSATGIKAIDKTYYCQRCLLHTKNDANILKHDILKHDFVLMT